jgi:hypothetical protein
MFFYRIILLPLQNKDDLRFLQMRDLRLKIHSFKRICLFFLMPENREWWNPVKFDSLIEIQTTGLNVFLQNNTVAITKQRRSSFSSNARPASQNSFVQTHLLSHQMMAPQFANLKNLKLQN